MAWQAYVVCVIGGVLFVLLYLALLWHGWPESVAWPFSFLGLTALGVSVVVAVDRHFGKPGP